MQLKLEALARHLQEPHLAPLYVVCGDEPLLILETVDALRAAARARDYLQRKVLLAERHFCWSELFTASQSPSLFNEKTLLELRIPNGKPGKEGGQALKDYVLELRKSSPQNNDTLTLITLPRLDMATQKSTWFSALESIGVIIKIDKVERHALGRWLTQRLALQNQSFASDEAGKQALQFLVDRVEGNLLAAHQEIQKLGLLHAPGELSLSQIQDAVLNVARYDVFKLTEVMLAGDMVRLSRTLEGLHDEGEAAILALWVLTEEIRLLCKLRQAMDDGHPLPTLLREYRIWGAREKLIPALLPRLTTQKLEQGLRLAAQLDRQAKGLATKELPSNIWDGLLTLACCIQPT